MPTLYLHSMAGELLLKTTVDAPAIKLIPPGLKAAVHILAARYIHPPLLEEWITLTWKNGTVAISISLMRYLCLALYMEMNVLYAKVAVISWKFYNLVFSAADVEPATSAGIVVSGKELTHRFALFA